MVFIFVVHSPAEDIKLRLNRSLLPVQARVTTAQLTALQETWLDKRAKKHYKYK